MANTIVSGGRPAQQLLGQSSAGILLQNLSATVPVFVGYDTSVTDQTFSGYLAPGGTYRTPKGSDVFLFALADAPVVYDYSPDASAGAGSGVQATLVQAYANLYDDVPTIPPSTAVTVLQSADVSQYQTLILSMRNAVSVFTKQGLIAVRVNWRTAEGKDLAGDSFLFHPYGNGQVRVPVKGPRALIIVQGDQYLAANYSGRITVTASSLPLKAEYASRPYGVGKLESGSMIWDAGPADLGYVQSISYNSPSGSTWYALPSYQGRMRLSYSINSGSVAIHAGIFDLSAAQNYPLFYSTQTGDQSVEMIAPASPLFVELSSASLRMTAAYQLAA